MFVWNYQMITNGRLKLGVGAGWIMPLIHGYAVQSKLGMIGKDIYITLIARRSRVFAGVRFLKRGVNAKGYVANDVETEQIVHTMEFTSFDMPNSNPNSNPHYSSYVQHRGSIPLFWSQDTSAMKPKPPIELNISDPYFRTAGLHFQQLFKRYGTPIIALNLIKIRETTKRESMLGDEFFECIKYLNLGLPDNKKILYISWDMSRAKRNREDDVLAILEEIGEEAISLTGFFHNGPEPYINYLKRKDEAEFRTRRESAEYSRTPNVIMAYRKNRRLQNGVLRSNCIDCLDRTNAAQSIIGKVAFAHQLYELGALAEPYLPFDSDAAVILEEMYRDLGDTIALQYGGSHLVNTVETYRKVNNWSSSSRDFLVTLKRYYSNSFVDAERQEGINLFLEKTGKHLESQQTTPDQILDLDADDPFHCGELVLQDDSKTAKSDISRFDGVESIHVGGYEQKYPNVDIWSQCYNPHSYTSLASISPPRFSFNSHYSPASGDVNASPFSSKSGDEKRPSKRQNYIRGLIKAGPSTLVPEEFSSNYSFARRFGLDTNLDVVRLDYLKTKHPMGLTNIPEGRSADQSFYPDIPLASLTESKRHELVRDELLEIFSKNQRGLDPHLVTHGRACDDNSESSTMSTDWTLFDIESVKNTASVSFDRSELFNDLPHVHIPTLSTFEALEYKEYVAQFESFAEKAYSHSQLFNIPRKDDQSASTGDGGLYTQLNTSLIQDICDIERDFTPFEPLNITKCT
ncbi:Polyphosphoinositide phosphatase [Zancudomyces culisetae]|uniref:Polyphosphoinositide phosphatase n=1 Tax=Zancudomyces culisetae TaxID=1213189 RepID=A0A1R1PIU6_ZANCU|nr:Polyphosphoinositide phosphatase [Zancudomyces culisetae]OMH80772.1 Polyphosphoinositide phosphatase [Zancudomyces culisetae]|eukprot:OMH80142.1 Polyphosphoinositide phosphatase [Zancudomyces culisetae]